MSFPSSPCRAVAGYNHLGNPLINQIRLLSFAVIAARLHLLHMCWPEPNLVTDALHPQSLSVPYPRPCLSCMHMCARPTPHPPGPTPPRQTAVAWVAPGNGSWCCGRLVTNHALVSMAPWLAFLHTYMGAVSCGFPAGPWAAVCRPWHAPARMPMCCGACALVPSGPCRLAAAQHLHYIDCIHWRAGGGGGHDVLPVDAGSQEWALSICTCASASCRRQPPPPYSLCPCAAFCHGTAPGLRLHDGLCSITFALC